MKLIPETELALLRVALLRRLGLIAGADADGFLFDLDNALDEQVGLIKVKVKKTGEFTCRFSVTALYDGNAEEVAKRILGVLDERIAYSSEAAATLTILAGAIQVSFLTVGAETGVATVCIRATQRA